MDDGYFTTALQHVVKESSIRGVVTLGGVKHTQGGITLVVNVDERARAEMVMAGSCLSLGLDGETGFMEQGGLNNVKKIEH